MKKILAITIAVALILSQGSIAGADYVSDVKLAPITASADLETGIVDVKTLSATVNELDGSVVSGGEITWPSGIVAEDAWTKATRYIEVKYDANQRNWGVLVYTDNMGTTMTANPEYTGDPTLAIDQQPSGLIGESNTFLACPMVLLLTKSRIVNAADLKVPMETHDGTPGTPGAVTYFENGLDEIPEGNDPSGDPLPVKYEKVWHWLKDIENTTWPVDTDGDGVADPNELVSDFNYLPGVDKYATIVTSLGISSGWWNAPSSTMVRDFNLGNRDGNGKYTLNVYLAADFRKAREKQHYTTGTLTLELYHETP